MIKRVVFITDCSDIAYSELRGNLLSMVREDIDFEIEPVISVEPFSIINGNFALRLMSEAYPPGTIFSIILNPFKKRPARIIGTTKEKQFIFLGANTGVFTWLFKDFGVKSLYELHDPGFMPFGGKYIHLPAIASVLNGCNLATLGKEFDPKKLHTLTIEPFKVVHIDNFGLMKLNATTEDLLKLGSVTEGTELKVCIGTNSMNVTYTKRMMSLSTGKWAIYPGSSLNLVELGKVRQNGAAQLNANIGDQVAIKIK